VSAARNAAAAARTGYVDAPLAASLNNPGCTVPPPAFQNHLSRGRRPRVPLRRSPPPSCARHVQAALYRAPPGCGPLRRAAAARGGYGKRRGRGVVAAGGRWGARVRGRRKKGFYSSYPSTTFQGIPGVHFPLHLRSIARLDFGPGVEDGVTTLLPPKVGRPSATLVAAVDADGNELTGIRLPDIRVPLATSTGWNGSSPPIQSARSQLSG